MPSLKAMAQEAQKFSKSSVLERSVGRKSASAIFKSTERVADSDLESDTESDSNSDSEEEPTSTAHHISKVESQKLTAVPLATKVNGQKHKSARAGKANQIHEEKEDDSSSETSSKHESSRDGNDEQQREDECDSDSESADKNGSGDSVAEEEPERHGISIIPPEISRDSGTTTKTQLSDSTPTIDYSPPAGFEKYSSNKEAQNKVSQAFSPSNLEGKQLWYITAPASIPISSVKEVSLQNMQFGKPTLSLNGQDYGFVQGHADEKGFTMVMVPDVNSIGYHVGRRTIDQTLHLQQVIKLSELTKHALEQDSSSQIPSKATVPAKKPVRQQPEGLKMRFRPFGFGNRRTGNIGSSPSSSESTGNIDSEPEEPASIPSPAFRRLVGLNQGYESARNPDANTRKAGPKYYSTKSDKPSETSSESIDNSRAKAEEFKAPRSTAQRSLKRKLSDAKAENFQTSPLKHPKISSSILKTSKIRQLSTDLKDLPSTEINGTSKLKNNSLKRSSILGSSAKIRAIHPSRAPESNTTSSNALNPSGRNTPILPPSRPRFLDSNPLGGFQVANGEKAASRSDKSHRSELGAEESMMENRTSHSQANESELRKTNEKTEKRQRQREFKLLSQSERLVSGPNVAGKAPRQASRSFSPENGSRSPTIIKPPPKLNLNKSLLDKKRHSSAPDTKIGIPSAEKTKAHGAKSKAPEQNGPATILPKGATSILPSPRRESVILPPKLQKTLFG